MLDKSPLGQTTVYVEYYSPELLFPIPRTLARDKIGLSTELPFQGEDIWNGYEISWLNLNGKPEIAMAEFIFPCNTPNVVESKSFKLYLNSFNQSKFGSFEEVQKVLQNDLSKAAGAPISVKLFPLSRLKERTLGEFTGVCIDTLDVATDCYDVNPDFLSIDSSTFADETLYTNLLKSNCLATGQPDWGSVLICYAGPKIDHEGLLKYFISFRRHSGFAEHCVEQIYNDLLLRCKPEKLSVYGRYTRRGGLDINPFRSNFETSSSNVRQFRQ